MIITNAAVIRLANSSPEVRQKLMAESGNYKAVIKKAKEIMCTVSTVADPTEKTELNNKLDELIGECSFPEMLERLPADAFVMRC